jgi:hypothetical protein
VDCFATMAGHVFGAHQVHTISRARNETDIGGSVQGCELVRFNGSVEELDRHVVDLAWARVSHFTIETYRDFNA